MSEKHSPGPWRVMEDGAVVDADASPVLRECGCGGGGAHEWAECEANARLIAAAPELLAALVEIIEAGANGDLCGFIAREVLEKHKLLPSSE